MSDVDSSKIAILTTVANFSLYYKTSVLFPDAIQRFVIDGTNGMHGINSILFMMEKLKKENIDWLIMADEDVIFEKPEVIFSIIEEMNENNYMVSGVRDGGVVTHRDRNPFVINTFFSIIDFKELINLWNKKEMLKQQYILENEFDDDLKNLIYKYDKLSLYEPYYCFYLWLRRKGKKILFLDAKMLEDSISNSIIYNNIEFLIHTWYARSYEENEKHTCRINILLDKILFKNDALKIKTNQSKTTYLKKSSFKRVQFVKKIYRKIVLKMQRFNGNLREIK